MTAIVFLGPSLPRAEAQRLLRADYRPPARQGDVFRAIEARPSAIVVIDGVFESAPSVWHHEFLAAQAAGIPLYGASSMGALRAAELPGVIEPVGEIAARFVSGEWNDDALVALLHGDEGSDFRALSVPWVNVFATVRETPGLSPKRARLVLEHAASIFYQARTWRLIVEPLTEAERKAVLAHRVDLKASDARACLTRVARQSKRALAAPRPSRFSSFVRRSRLPAEGAEGADDGVRTLLLADFARQAGITADPDRVAFFREVLEVPAADLRETWAEALALEEMILAMPERFVPDGPSRAEGAALTRARATRRPRR